MKLKSFLLISALFFGFTLFSQAQTATPGINKSQVKQQKRIKQGVKSGEITKAEFARLQLQQVRFHRSKAAAKSDGVITPKERFKLNLHQAKTSTAIYHQKHDKQKRY